MFFLKECGISQAGSRLSCGDRPGRVISIDACHAEHADAGTGLPEAWGLPSRLNAPPERPVPGADRFPVSAPRGRSRAA